MIHSPFCLDRARLHRGFRYVVGQPAVGRAARLGEAMRQQELRIVDQPLEPFFLQVAWRQIAQQHRRPSSSAPACRRGRNRHAQSLRRSARTSALRWRGQARCRRILPARRAYGCRLSPRLAEFPAAGGPRASSPIRAASSPRMKGITTSSTKSRHDCRIILCSSERCRMMFVGCGRPQGRPYDHFGSVIRRSLRPPCGSPRNRSCDRGRAVCSRSNWRRTRADSPRRGCRNPVRRSARRRHRRAVRWRAASPSSRCA